MAGAASAAEKHVTQDRDIVEGGYRRFAVRAAGARAHDGFVSGQAHDADIEKAAEDEPKQNDNDYGQRFHSFSREDLFAEELREV